MSSESPKEDRVWKALGSPVRRRLLDALRDGPKTTGDLCRLLSNLSRFAVMQHLSVLVEAELVIVHREGRIRWNSLNVVPLQNIHERWISPYRALWAGAMTDLKRKVESRPAGEKKKEKR